MPGVAVDGDAAAGHAAADPLDLPRVAADVDLVAGRALDGEEIVHAALPLAQVDTGSARMASFDERRHHVGRERLGLERHVRLLL